MQNGKNFISPEKIKELELELADLKGPARQKILDSLAFAKSLGDLSENAEYHNAREEQGRLEERIGQIEEILQNSEIVTKHTTAAVGIGSVVTVRKEKEKEEKIFTVVGAQESDMARGMISHNSPLGEALYEKKKGDIVTFATPKGETKYTIVDIK
jgi:transcription elongation factor GreA